jgi:hypothetical protein
MEITEFADVTGSLGRFWRKINASGECWLWKGGLIKGGYGELWMKRTDGTRKNFHTHRLAYLFAHGELPEGLMVLHSCDTPGCVRPSHLFLGTQTDNMQDCIAKGRYNRVGLKGQKNPKAKLTIEQVEEIRRRYGRRGKGGALQRELAAEFGITQTQVSNIVRGQHWPTAEWCRSQQVIARQMERPRVVAAIGA